MVFPGCMFSVAMIQRLRLPPATKAMSADLHGEPAAAEREATAGATARGRARTPHSPARVVSDADDLLGEGLRRGPLLVAQALEVDHAVAPLVSPTDSPHADAACGTRERLQAGPPAPSRPRQPACARLPARAPVWSRPPVFFMPTGRTVYLVRHFHSGSVVQRGTEPLSPRQAAGADSGPGSQGWGPGGSAGGRARRGPADSRRAPKARQSPSAAMAAGRRRRTGRGRRGPELGLPAGGALSPAGPRRRPSWI